MRHHGRPRCSSRRAADGSGRCRRRADARTGGRRRIGTLARTYQGLPITRTSSGPTVSATVAIAERHQRRRYARGHVPRQLERIPLGPPTMPSGPNSAGTMWTTLTYVLDDLEPDGHEPGWEHPRPAMLVDVRPAIGAPPDELVDKRRVKVDASRGTAEPRAAVVRELVRSPVESTNGSKLRHPNQWRCVTSVKALAQEKWGTVT